MSHLQFGLRAILLVTLLVALVGPYCSWFGLSPGASIIDSSKVIDFRGRTGGAYHTVFTFANADSNGWPNLREDQVYVRFLQDRGVSVGFIPIQKNGCNIRLTVVDSLDEKKVLAADMAANKEGVAKPPLVRDPRIAP